MSTKNKQYKYSPEVRAFLAKTQRDYRARKKQKQKADAEVVETPAAANYQPAGFGCEVTSKHE